MLIKRKILKYLLFIIIIFAFSQVFINLKDFRSFEDPYRDKNEFRSFKHINFVRNSENCRLEVQKYYTKSVLSYVNYCDTYNKTNEKIERVSTSDIRDILASDFTIFNLSSTSTENQQQECSSHCRNIAHPYMAQVDFLCYCLTSFLHSPIQQNEISINNPYIYVPIFETGAHPIKYKKPYLAKIDNSVVVIYLLMLNGRDAISLSRLFRTIYSEKDYYFIHIDRRQTFLLAYLKRLDFDNVFVFEWSMSTIWGGTSLLTAYRRAMQEIIAKDLVWDFIINLSESDYLIRPKNELDTFLYSNKDQNFIKTSGESVAKFIQKQALDKAFIECDEHLHLLENRALPKNLIIDGGSDWFVLSYRFVHYLVTSNDGLVNDLFSFFENSLLPAETFFHTALQNSHFCHKVVNSNLRFTNWNRLRGCRCQHSSVIGWCGCSPSVLRTENYKMLLKQTIHDPTIFFARKFDSSIDSLVLDLIDTKVHNLSVLCDKTRYNHILNFHNSLQDRAAYISLVSLLYSISVSKYVEENNCAWKSVTAKDEISLFLGINHNKPQHPDVILYYQRELIHFEAVLKYTGKAGALFNLSIGNMQLQPLHSAIKSLLVSQNYDSKENVFRTPTFLMMDHVALVLELQIQCVDSRQFTFNVMFTDPNSVQYSFRLQNITATINRQNQYFDGNGVTFAWYEGFDIPQPYRAGLWKVVLYSENFQYPLVKSYFYIQLTKTNIIDDSAQRFEQWQLKRLCIWNNKKSCDIPNLYKCQDCLFSKWADFLAVKIK